MTDEEIKRLNGIVNDITPESIMERMADGYVPTVRPYPETTLSASEITRMRIQDELIHFIKAVDWGNLPDKTQTATFQLGETQYVQVDIQLKDIPKGHRMR